MDHLIIRFGLPPESLRDLTPEGVILRILEKMLHVRFDAISPRLRRSHTEDDRIKVLSYITDVLRVASRELGLEMDDETDLIQLISEVDRRLSQRDPVPIDEWFPTSDVELEVMTVLSDIASASDEDDAFVVPDPPSLAGTSEDLASLAGRAPAPTDDRRLNLPLLQRSKAEPERSTWHSNYPATSPRHPPPPPSIDTQVTNKSSISLIAELLSQSHMPRTRPRTVLRPLPEESSDEDDSLHYSSVHSSESGRSLTPRSSHGPRAPKSIAGKRYVPPRIHLRSLRPAETPPAGSDITVELSQHAGSDIESSAYTTLLDRTPLRSSMPHVPQDVLEIEGPEGWEWETLEEPATYPSDVPSPGSPHATPFFAPNPIETPTAYTMRNEDEEEEYYRLLEKKKQILQQLMRLESYQQN